MHPVNPTWRRHDAHRFIRHDAHRFFTPAGLEEQKRAAEAEKAARREAAEIDAAEQDAFEREILALRHDFAKLKLEYELRRFQRKYSPDQPRVPAGSPDGGQWTSDGGGAVSDSDDEENGSGSDGAVMSDATPDPVRSGTQLANVIRICLLGTRSISTVSGQTSWWAHYTCADGYTFRNYGPGGKVPAFARDPRFSRF